MEENRLCVYNGDLTGRLLAINADKWTREELANVISIGEKLLNISFHDKFKDELLTTCFESVYIVQEACRLCCMAENVYATQEKWREIGENLACADIVSSVVNQQSGRFNSFLTQFSDGFQATALEMHKWLLYPILTGSLENIEKGTRQDEIRSILHSVHPKGSDLNSGNVTQSLQSVSSLQIKKDIKPIVLDYDQTNLRLRIVDKSFLIWLSKQDRMLLLDLVGLPYPPQPQ